MFECIFCHVDFLFIAVQAYSGDNMLSWVPSQLGVKYQVTETAWLRLETKCVFFFLTGALSSRNLEMFAEAAIAEAPILMPNFQHLSIYNQI